MKEINKQFELVDSLASTIQNKIILPAEENISLLHNEISQVEKRISLLEETAAALAAAYKQIKLAASISILGLAILAIIQISILLN